LSWKPATVTFCVWLVLTAIVIGVEIPPAGEPGIYYDEALFGQQGRDFLEPDRFTQHAPSTDSTYIFGRRLALWHASYLGSLKSHLAIPFMAVFGADLPTLRVATAFAGLLGLLFLMLWARRTFGLPAALVTGVLVAFDPSFIFFGACEWGPYTTMLFCRGIGLYGVTVGWQTRRSWLLILGALFMGLGVYARADFVVIGIAAFVGLLAIRGRLLWSEIRERPGATIAALAAVVLGSLPMLLAIPALLVTSAGIAERGGLDYRAQVLWSTLDGSHFHRLMQVGGVFEQIFDHQAPASLFGVAAVAALVAAIGMLARARAQRVPARDGITFLVVTVSVLATAMWLLPGAVRAHHTLNLLPFAHLLVAVVGIELACSQKARIAAAAMLLVVVASEVRVTWLTRELIAETGGRGRWSNSLDAFARELEADRSAVAVSLDWGFHSPIVFLTTKEGLLEPIWTIPRLLARGRPWVHHGNANYHYLAHDEPFDLFQLGPKFLAATEALGPELAEIRPHVDRQGTVAFYSVRFLGPHQLVYTGDFEVRFGPSPRRSP
jgi:hypothetical protein